MGEKTYTNISEAISNKIFGGCRVDSIISITDGILNSISTQYIIEKNRLDNYKER